MLKNVHPLLTPELLQVLAAMGHGDEVAVVDANFPADSVARQTVHGRAVHLAGASVPDAVEALLTVLPLDEFVAAPVQKMAGGEVGGDMPEVQREVQAVVDAAAGRSWPLGALERFAFYDAARAAYAVVLTGETRIYANVLIKKGVVLPAG